MDRQLVWQVAAILNRGDDTYEDDEWEDDNNPAGRPYVEPTEEEMEARIARYHERQTRKRSVGSEVPDPIV